MRIFGDRRLSHSFVLEEMPSSIQSDQNMRWNAARRKRNQSRFEIRERMKEECSSNSKPTEGDEDNNCSVHIGDDHETSNKLKTFLQAISQGTSSFFSLQLFSTEHELLSKPLPTSLLSTYKIQSFRPRFGQEYVSDLLTYIQMRPHCTLFEYALMIERYSIAQTFISGGINPCDLLHYHNDDSICLEKVEYVSALVMKKLVIDFIPPSLAVYIAKSVFDLKLSTYVSLSRNEDTSTMQYLNKDKHHLLYLPKCKHTVSEMYLWEDLMNNLDERIEGDVFRCPICDECPNNNNNDDSSDGIAINATRDNELSPSEKCQLSLKKFQYLPKDTKILKKLPKKRKKKRTIHSTWREALLPIIGSSQDVRSDKFKRYVDMGAIHHCRACLEEGIDVNKPNEYNQTPLYIACWKNHVDLVELFLQWGADLTINANGLLSPRNVAVENNHTDVVKVLDKYEPLETNMHMSSLKERIRTISRCDDVSHSRSIFTLIHDKNHPGYGAFYIDNILPQSIIDSLNHLYESIPVAHASVVKQKKIDEDIPCSLRHYFCDSEGYLRILIGEHITQVLRNDSGRNVYDDLHAYVFPHMRFLNYNQPGGELLPHIDLTKVDTLSGRRSTHTFILYLRDCEIGGETALLQKLSESGPKAYHGIIDPAIKPQCNRVLVFPHACPHQGMKVVSSPKILLRGEILLEKLSFSSSSKCQK